MTAQFGARIALVGFTGTGKTTIASLLLHELRMPGWPARLIKLAAPLYRLQQRYYAEAGVLLTSGAQDQELMAEVAARLRRISPRALLDQFLDALAQAPPGAAIVNDDLRVCNPDASGLIDAGFHLIRLECPEDIRRARLAARHDLAVIDEPAVLGAEMSTIPTELTLNTHIHTPTQTVRHVLDHLHTRRPTTSEVQRGA